MKLPLVDIVAACVLEVIQEPLQLLTEGDHVVSSACRVVSMDVRDHVVLLQTCLVVSCAFLFVSLLVCSIWNSLGQTRM